MGINYWLRIKSSLVKESYRRDLCEFFAHVAVKYSEPKANPTQKKHFQNLV
jgi:hypothetical protein